MVQPEPGKTLQVKQRLNQGGQNLCLERNQNFWWMAEPESCCSMKVPWQAQELLLLPAPVWDTSPGVDPAVPHLFLESLAHALHPVLDAAG